MTADVRAMPPAPGVAALDVPVARRDRFARVPVGTETAWAGMHPVRGQVEYEEVLRRIARLSPPRPVRVSVALDRAVGCAADREIRARFDLPRFARSALDGYAVRAEDLAGATDASPVRLRVVGSVRIGSPPRRASLRPGDAVAIATGGAVPPRASAVVRVEDTRADADGVWIRTSTAPGDGIDPVGSDLRAGDVLVRSGERIGPLRVAALAAQGFSRVEVRRAPLLSIRPTGPELRRPGSALGPGRIYESNGPAVASLARAAGARVRLWPPAADDPRVLARALASDPADVVAFVGGSSVGREDFLARSLEENGEVWVHGIAIQPGRPTILGARGRRLVLGLPGHPASCVAAAYLVLRPLLARLGATGASGRAVSRPLLEELDLPRPIAYFRPVRDEGSGVRPLFTRASRVSSFAAADGYLVERGPKRLRRGDAVSVHPV